MKDSTMIDITLAKDIPHQTTITDDGIEYWTVTAITQHIGVAKSTFASYVARGQALQPAFQLERTRLWDAAEIKQWHASPPQSNPTPTTRLPEYGEYRQLLANRRS